MSNPNNAIYWVIAALLCWPSPIAVLITIFIVNAFHRGWISIKIDRTKAPRLNVGRNAH
jgi:hypothetical protein